MATSTKKYSSSKNSYDWSIRTQKIDCNRNARRSNVSFQGTNHFSKVLGSPKSEHSRTPHNIFEKYFQSLVQRMENGKAFFYYGRVAITFAIGLPLYGTIPAFTGTRNSEDLLFWKCDTSHPGCDIICYNRFLPIMPGRLLQFQVISKFPTHPSLMRHDSCHIYNLNSNYQ